MYRRQNNISFPSVAQYVVWLSWIISIILMSGTLFSAWWFYKPNYKYDAFVAALYGALYRTTWAIGVSWTIIAVSTGNGGKKKNTTPLLGIPSAYKNIDNRKSTTTIFIFINFSKSNNINIC